MSTWKIQKGICFDKFKKSFFSNLENNQNLDISNIDFNNLEKDTSKLLSNCINPFEENDKKLSTNLMLEGRQAFIIR